MTDQIKQINEIVLHKDDPLAKRLESVSAGEIEKVLLDVECIVSNSPSYPKGILEEINLGHWDIYRGSGENEKTITIPLSRPLMARSPNLDVRKKGMVAIDFGTKSTTVAIIDEDKETKKQVRKLLRIGAGQYLKDKERKEDYENPTFMHFVNIDYFEGDYHSIKSRPLTRWEDLRVAYGAKTEFDDTGEEKFYQFFSDLKQWANNQSKIPFYISDSTNEPKRLKNLVDCGEKDFNPIEVYAYYIGRYINNMTNGIYLKYVLSYPVKYPRKVREKIKESFERGLKKAIPNAVLTTSEHGKEFEVEISVSEPAAYAISALKEYGFISTRSFEKEKEYYYGVFDFGGGTTDFDFGICRETEEGRLYRERQSKMRPKYNIEIEHLKSGGNEQLGGENLLELLAYEVFVDNEEIMRENNCCFAKPNYPVTVAGNIQSLISNSQKARKNIKTLMKHLRIFWENAHLFREERDDRPYSDEEQKIRSALNDLQVMLSPEEGVSSEKPIKIDKQKLLNILEREIQNGVDQFFSAFEIATEGMEKLKEFHIFLGGNSSRSLLVTEAFNRAKEKMINEASKKTNGKIDQKNLNFILYPPLGTPEAEKKREELELPKDTDDPSRQVTCKSGVVFGLLDGMLGKIRVISEISQDDEAKFEFYLGDENLDGYFEVIFDPNDAVESKEKSCIMGYIGDFVLYYTKDPRVANGDFDIRETRMLSVSFDTEQEEGGVYVEILGPSRIKLIARSKDGKTLEEKPFDLED